MKVRISYVVEATNDFRRAINLFYGKDGLATREDVILWMRTYGESMNDDLGSVTESENES